MQVLILRINIPVRPGIRRDLQRVSEFIHHHFTRIIELRNAETVAPSGGVLTLLLLFILSIKLLINKSNY